MKPSHVSLAKQFLPAIAASVIWLSPCSAEEGKTQRSGPTAPGAAAPDRTADVLRRASEQAAQMPRVIPDARGMTNPSGTALDPGEIAQRYSALKPESPSGLFIAVSLSMPQASLNRLAEQATKTGGRLTIRGLIDNSLKKTVEATADMVKAHPGLQFEIDPRVFQRYRIQRVPTFVLALGDPSDPSCKSKCDASDQFVIVSGDVSLAYALEQISRHGPARFQRLAQTQLKQLEERQ